MNVRAFNLTAVSSSSRMAPYDSRPYLSFATLCLIGSSDRLHSLSQIHIQRVPGTASNGVFGNPTHGVHRNRQSVRLQRVNAAQQSHGAGQPGLYGYAAKAVGSTWTSLTLAPYGSVLPAFLMCSSRRCASIGINSSSESSVWAWCCDRCRKSCPEGFHRRLRERSALTHATPFAPV